MFKRLSLVALIVLITGCHQKSNKQESAVSLKLSGLWISQDYVRTLMEDSSISIASRDSEFFISILFAADSKIEALGADEIEPAIGRLVGDSIKFDNGSHFIKATATDILEIDADGKTFEFKRIDLDGYHNTFEGRDYLNSLLLLGKWKFIDPQLNQVSQITFGLNNGLSGISTVNSYYPSSYLTTDILLFGDSTGIKRSFIVEKSNHGFILHEVENFDWDESIFKPLGITYKLER